MLRELWTRWQREHHTSIAHGVFFFCVCFDDDDDDDDDDGGCVFSLCCCGDAEKNSELAS